MIMNSYYKKILFTINKITILFPQQTLGKHLATAFDEHQIENLNDRDLFNILNDYLIELESDIPHCEDVEEILKQGMNLNSEDLIEEE